MLKTIKRIPFHSSGLGGKEMSMAPLVPRMA